MVIPSRHVVTSFLVAGLWPLWAEGVQGQGTFNPATDAGDTFGGPSVAAAVFDRDGVSLLSGSNYSAQYYAGPLGTADDQLVAVGSPIVFESKEGFLSSGPVVSVPGVPPGSKARIQLRVWHNEAGTKARWDDASLRAASASFDSLPLSAAKTTIFNATLLSGLKSFSLPLLPPNRSPVRGGYAEAFSNSNYSDPLGGFRPTVTLFWESSANGRVVLANRIPGSVPSDLVGPILIRHEPLVSTVSAELAVPPPQDGFAWNLTGISADGELLVGTREGIESPKVLAIRHRVAEELPLLPPAKVSGDARFVFGRDLNANQLVRMDLSDTHQIVIVKVGGFAVSSVSRDGSAAVVDGAVWTATGGLLTDLPRGFKPASVSGDGRTFVGQAENHPAYWTLDGGLVVLQDGEPGVVGELTGVSFDGSIFAGWARTPNGRVQFWRRNGSAYRLAELLPNGAAKSVKSLTSTVALRLSDDGRRAFGTAQILRLPDGVNPGPVGNSYGWVADLVFPGDAPKVAVGKGSGSNLVLHVPTASGFSFQLQQSQNIGLGDWAPLGVPLVGNDQEQLVTRSPSSSSGFFRVLAVPQ